MIIDNKEYTYYAFISYKREDEKWAKWLEKELESYGFPVALRRENHTLPSKIRPVFRDQSELSGGNLKQEIEKALQESRYLIVVCSPQAAKSPWVSKEVQFFIDHEQESSIIPFIIGGAPNSSNPAEECFPEGLRQLSNDREILGININEMGREAAVIKVIAYMFNLRFDTLWQRHERAKRRRRIALICGILSFAVICFGIGLYMSYLNTQIAAQRDRAENQARIALAERNRADIERKNALKANQDLAHAKDSIEVQSDLLAQSNRNLAESNRRLTEERDNVKKASIQILSKKRRLVAREANQMLQEGRTLEAWDLLLENSPSETNMQNPISPEIVSILYKIYYLLNDNNHLNCIANLESDLKDNNEHLISGYYGPFLSPDGKYNAYYKDGFFILYDILSNKKFVLDGTDLSEGSEFRYSQDGNYLFGYGFMYLFCWNINSKRLIFKKYKEDFTNDNFDFDEENWKTVEKLYGKRLSTRTYKNFECTDSIFFNKLQKSDYGCGLRMPELKNRDISDFQISDDIFVIQNYVFSSRKIDYLGPTLDKYCHIHPKPNEIIYYEPLLSIPSFHKNPTIDFENFKWKLVSSNYGTKLFYKECIETGENNNQILNYSCDSILIVKNHKNFIITTIPSTTIARRSNSISNVHIIDSESLLFEAGLGPHVLYNIDTYNRTIFQQSFLNEDSGGYDFTLWHSIYSDFIIKDGIFFTISLSGAMSFWDINSGVLLWEFALPHTNASVDSPIVFNVRRIGEMALYITLANRETHEQIMNYSFRIPHLITFINYMRKQRFKFTH